MVSKVQLLKFGDVVRQTLPYTEGLSKYEARCVSCARFYDAGFPRVSSAADAAGGE